MSFSVQPDQIVGIADRVRIALDDMLERSDALRDAVDGVAEALARVTQVRDAFDAVAGERVGLARGMVARGYAIVSVLGSIITTYLDADEEMAASTSAEDARAPLSPFDPGRFGSRAP